MSRRMLNTLGAPKTQSLPQLPDNPFELVKSSKPIQVQHYTPNAPIFLTKEQWDFVCNKTHDATTPFKVEVTVIDNKEKTEEEEGVEENKDDEPYVPKRVRKSKK